MGNIMKIMDSDRYTPIETALKEAGLKIDSVVKHGKKTVITVKQMLPCTERGILKRGRTK